MSQYSAAQVMLVIAALREDKEPAKDGKPQPHRGLRTQAHMKDRQRLLDIARKRGATVWDVTERNKP